MNNTLDQVAPPVSAWLKAVHRAQEILLRPRRAWQNIAIEDDEITAIYKNYLFYLAAVPAVAGFIGQSLVGMGVFGVTVRVPIMHGLVAMVVGYVLSLAMVYVVAQVASLLAPKFQGQAHVPSGFKLIAYGATAGMLGGIFSLVPSLAMLGLVAGLYSIYLIHVGAPTLMRVSPERSVGYTAALVACAIVAGLVVGLVSSLFIPRSPLGTVAAIGAKDVKISVPGTSLTIDAGKIEDAGRRLEQAKASGDGKAAEKAMGEMLSAAMGGAGTRPIEAQALRELLPSALGGLERSSVEARSDGMMGMQVASAEAMYRSSEHHVEVRLQDIGAASMLAASMAAWTRSTVDKETPEEVERVYRRGDVYYKESYRKDGSRASLLMLLPNGVLLEGNGNVPMAQLQGLLQSLPGKVASLQRPA
jgi:hypothetical protein